MLPKIIKLNKQDIKYKTDELYYDDIANICVIKNQEVSIKTLSGKFETAVLVVFISFVPENIQNLKYKHVFPIFYDTIEYQKYNILQLYNASYIPVKGDIALLPINFFNKTFYKRRKSIYKLLAETILDAK